MRYVCQDRGSERCPCILMEAGQCYTCNMSRKGICDCSVTWQGVCPYTEYMQRNRNCIYPLEHRIFRVRERKNYSEELAVVKIHVPRGFALKCRKAGAFVIAGEDGWTVPLSVMECVSAAEESTIAVAVNITGPKTMRLMKRCSAGSLWQLRGPYFSGIVNGEIYGPEKLSVIVAKGIASIPLINIRSQIGNNMAAFYLDSRKLPEKFVFDFFGGMDFEKVSLQNDVEAVGRKIRKDYEYCLNCSTERPNLMFMTSPDFVQRISEEAQIPMRQIIFPNHANMCCGEGICGACSHTDNDGTTVRACKCSVI